MKKISLVCLLILSINVSAAEKPGLWDAIKEAGKGVVWMIRVEVCKIDMALFSKEGLNMFYANYKCYHKDHNTIYQTK
jgi:hypothetical protein